MFTKLHIFMASMSLLASLLVGNADAQTTASKELRVMSFNVRNSGAKDGLNGWKNRKELFFTTIEQFKPDLLGTQEVLADQYDAMVERMKGYTPVGVARDDGK